MSALCLNGALRFRVSGLGEGCKGKCWRPRVKAKLDSLPDLVAYVGEQELGLDVLLTCITHELNRGMEGMQRCRCSYSSPRREPPAHDSPPPPPRSPVSGTLSNPVDANMLLDRLAAATNMTVAATAGAPTADGCPIQPATTTLDFAGVAPVCTAAAPAAAFCANCTCALLTSFMPAFKKAGLMIDPTMPSMFPVDKAGAAVASCVVAYAPQ